MTPDDWQLMWKLDQDPEVKKYIDGGKLTSKEDIQNKMIPRMNSYSNHEKGWGVWKVLEMSTHTFLGWILVRPMYFFSEKRDDSNLELGWRFHRKFWGKGFATEAAKGMMDHIMREAPVRTFCAIVDKENTASIGVMKKLGMSFIDHRIIPDPLGDFDVAYYEMTELN